jgi:low temperature requirement protein LtrA
MGKNSIWWEAPKNFSDRKNERKIGWLELFYDLVYVAAIGQLTHQLAAHPSWDALAYSFLLFALVFWSWVNGSQYYDLHGNDGIRTRFFTFFQMLAVAAVAISISDAFNGNHQGFAIAFLVVQCIVTYLWWSVGLYDPGHKKFNIFYTVNYSIAFALLLLSVFTGHGIATVLWTVALVFNLTPPLTAAATIVKELKKIGQVFTASATIVERFGLFTIIVMTESILSTVNGISEIENKQAVTWVAFILGILIAFLLWSLYFDMTSGQETKRGYQYLQFLIFLHFPLLASLGVVGASIKLLLINIGHELPLTIQWMFCISLSIILYCIVGIANIKEEDEEDGTYIRPVSRLLIIAGVVMLIIPFFGTHLATLTFMVIIAIILFIPVFIGIRSWGKNRQNRQIDLHEEQERDETKH